MAKTTTTLFPEEREQIILDFLKNQGKIRVSEVIDQLGVSPSTARLLLQKMDDKGLLQRTHGGAVAINQTVPAYQRDFHNIENQEKKLMIASAAADTVQNGDFIALGSGTTTFLLATMLHDKQELTVVTDSIPIAYELSGDEQITLYVCGGWIMHRNSACRGLNAENFFNDLSVVDKSYCGTDSIHAKYGLTSVDFDPRTEAAVCRIGRERYILADSSKFHVRPYINKLVELEEIGHVISDYTLESEYITALESKGIEVILGKTN
ncbi:MAG: DeoR/GlpR family DNA-binding transcription regulator [Lachnospiraceae bacterium]|nr:DeoR/GlpR family DNA-binding transcription regulator [Lachnospiraceae bacterium]